MNELNFVSKVESKSGIIAILFSSLWLSNISQLKGKFSKLELEFPDIQFFAADADILSVLIDSFNVESLPAVILLDNMSYLDKIEGTTLITPLRNYFRNLMKQRKK